MSNNKIFFWGAVFLIFYKRNEILSFIEKTSRGKLEEHKRLKEVGQLTMNKKNFFKREEARLTKGSREKVERIADELDETSNQKIKSCRLRYDVEHLIIVTRSIKESDEMIEKKFTNLLESSYNDLMKKILKK